jgi:hypothetical protein
LFVPFKVSSLVLIAVLTVWIVVIFYFMLKRKTNLSISSWNILSTSRSLSSIALVMNGFAFVPFVLIDRRIFQAFNHFLFARHEIGSNGALCGFVHSCTNIAY